MRTLNEVIKAIEECRNSYVAGKIIKSDALHYLKAFRDAKNALDAERERTIEAYCQWKDAREKLEAQTSQMMWVDKHFQFEISDNSPLDWETLKQMEGKPVWVEYNFRISDKKIRDNSKRWCIVREFKPWHDTEIIITDNGFILSKNEQVKDWQAYRKERE